MGRGVDIEKIRTRDTFRPSGIPMPIAPTENKGIMSGPMRKPRGRRKIDKRGSRRGGDFSKVTRFDGTTKVNTGKIMSQAEYEADATKRINEGMKRGIAISPMPYSMYVERQQPEYKQRQAAARQKENELRIQSGDTTRAEIEKENELRRRFERNRRRIERRRPLTGGYDPKSGVRYTDTGVPTAVQQTRRVAVQDPTLGGPPEREVPIPRERRQRITRESDPRGGAPFSPDERAMVRDRFFETMFDRADERKQQKAMERAERDNVRDALRSERELRASEMAGPGDERQGRRGEGEMRRRRGGGGMRRRRGRRRDFTRRRSQMEGGRRGRSDREMAEFRDRYVSTLR